MSSGRVRTPREKAIAFVAALMSDSDKFAVWYDRLNEREKEEFIEDVQAEAANVYG